MVSEEAMAKGIVGLILGLLPANERHRYFVTTSLIGWAKTSNQPCIVSVASSVRNCEYSKIYLGALKFNHIFNEGKPLESRFLAYTTYCIIAMRDWNTSLQIKPTGCQPLNFSWMYSLFGRCYPVCITASYHSYDNLVWVELACCLMIA